MHLPAQTHTQGNQEESVTSREELRAILLNAVAVHGSLQSGVVASDRLEKLLDRRHMVAGWKIADGMPYPLSGVGYEVIPGDPTLDIDEFDDAEVAGADVLEAGDINAPSIAEGGAAVLQALGSADISAAGTSASLQTSGET